MKRVTLDAASMDYIEELLRGEVASFEDLDFGLNENFGTRFGEKGCDAEIALLEEKLRFRFSASYVRAATGINGDYASLHFRDGWWRVLETSEAVVFWSSTLSLSGAPSAKHADENTLLVTEKFETAGLQAIPFGQARRIQKSERMSTDGWLCFDRADARVRFAEFDFAATYAIATGFDAMMAHAAFVDMYG